MAYRDFTIDPLAVAEDVANEAANPSASRPFSALEWTTIALARRDSLASLRQPGRLSRAVGSLFGIGEQTRLADPALETLRRLAVNAWHYGYRLPVSEIKAFLAAGFTVDQLESLLDSIGQARISERRRVIG